MPWTIILEEGKNIMICSKCGAECGDNQAFCPKCGSPIQLMADFNLIEKELASSIDEFMNEIESEKNDGEESLDDFEQMKTVDVPLDEINMELKMVDISRGQMSPAELDEIDDEDDEEDISPVYIPEKKKDNNKKKNNKKKNNKKMYAIIGGCVAAVAVLAVVLVILFSGKSGDKDDKAKDFSYYYAEAEKAYDANDYDTALDMALKAVENSKNKENEKKARKLVSSVYEKQNYFGEYYIKNLEELYFNGEKSEENGKKLAEAYMKGQNMAGFIKLYEDIDENTAKAFLGEKYVEKPSSNIDRDEYKNHINIEMTAKEGCEIYYVVSDVKEATPAKYSSPVEINEVGEYKIKAYAVSADYAVSYPAEFKFTIVEGANEGPAVSPAGGTYYEPLKISVEVPDGAKAYYTLDGEIPDENATEYTEEFDMPRGISKVKVIVIDKYGNKSEITSVQYNLKLNRTETISSGRDKVGETYFNKGITDADGNKADGSKMEISYVDTVVISNVEYFMYQVIFRLEDKTETGMAYVAVNTYDGTVEENVVQAGEEFVIEKPEENVQ